MVDATRAETETPLAEAMRERRRLHRRIARLERESGLADEAFDLLDALEEVWRFADNLADGAPDASPSHQRANELAGKYRDLLKKHGRTPWEDR